MKILCCGMSDTGRKRDHNEDSFLIDEELSLFVVADGMGGHAGGGTASRLAVETIDGEPAARSAHRAAFVAAGFYAESTTLVLRRTFA